MQPQNYTIYLKNLAQTVSRNLANVDEVITGLDTSWAGGRHATQNYLNQRFTIPAVRKQLCQEMASKQDTTFTLIEKSVVKVTHSALMPMVEKERDGHEHSSTLPGGGFMLSQNPKVVAKNKQKEDRIYQID